MTSSIASLVAFGIYIIMMDVYTLVAVIGTKIRGRLISGHLQSRAVIQVIDSRKK